MAIFTFAPKQSDFVIGGCGQFRTAFIFKVERASPKCLKINSDKAELPEFNKTAIKEPPGAALFTTEGS